MEDKNKTVRPRGTDRAKVIQVIATESICGLGTSDDPVRPIFQYWSLDGDLLAVKDSLYEASLSTCRSN